MTHTIIIGEREFTCVRMNAFAANRILMRLQKIVLPVLGSFTNSESKSLMDMDIEVAARAIAEHLDESNMVNIVMPMFVESKVFCSEVTRFVKTESDVNMCFKTENLFDLYELIFEVGRYQFAPFFESLRDRFGALLDGPRTSPSPQESSTNP